jgi:hypothetical protein
LIVGGLDYDVIKLNEDAYNQLNVKRLVIPATHLLKNRE